MSDKELVALAMQMREKSYCPYSHFAVGAALECEDGEIFTGCNVENAAYGESICAERAAVVKAVSAGRHKFTRIAVAGSAASICTPCGACRQVLNEFAPDIRVICSDNAGNFESLPLKELLPKGFGPSSI